MKLQTTVLCFAAWVLGTLPVPSFGQASSFDQLNPAAVQVRIGESVQITDETGKRFNAKIAAISGQTLGVVVNGARRDLSESQVLKIRRTIGTQAAKGAKIGLIAGAVFGTVAAVSICSEDREACPYSLALGVPLWAGIGAGGGALIGLAFPRHETVFDRKLSISPILNKDAKGARIAFSF